MTATTLRKTAAGTIAIAAMLLAGATSLAITQQRGTAADTALQALADEAALAGVSALAASEGQSDAQRIAAAHAAAHKVIASRSGIVPVVAPSLDDMTMQVALTTRHHGRGLAFSATAHYVQPGSAVSPASTAEAMTKRTRG